MTPRSARRALGAGGAVAAVVAMTMPAFAEELGVGWEGEITDERIVDGYEATDEVLRVPVTFEYTGAPESVITSVTLELVPTDDGCDSRAYVQPLAEGDGDPTDETGPPETTATTGTTVRPPSPSPGQQTVHTASWPFRVDPGCNGIYDLSTYATADPAGPAEPGDPGTESEPIVVESVRLSLRPPQPSAVEAIARADRTVTVGWTAPEAWTKADDIPTDAIGYRVERVAGDGSFVPVGETGVDGSSVVDDDLVSAPAGSYRYRVVALRNGATGTPVESAAAEGLVELGAPSTSTTAPNRAGGAASRPRVGTSGRGVGQPAVAPAEEFDPGFDPELDYAEFGAPEAVPPEDASLLEIVTDDPVGVGVAVPAAVGLCLAVWAGHLRHLSRRAAPPYS